MGITVGRTFENSVVQMDNMHFKHCTLANCILEYSGKPVILEETEFKGCQFRLTGEAALTVNFLKCFRMLDTGVDYLMVNPQTPPSI